MGGKRGSNRTMQDLGVGHMETCKGHRQSPELALLLAVLYQIERFKGYCTWSIFISYTSPRGFGPHGPVRKKKERKYFVFV